MTSFVILATRAWAGGWTFDCRLANQIFSLRDLGFEDTTLWEWLEWWQSSWALWGIHVLPCSQRTRENGSGGTEDTLTGT